MKTITLTSKNQITIPAALVRELGFDKNRRLNLDVRNGEIILKRQQSIEEILAPIHVLFKGKIKRPLTDEELREAKRQAWEERADRLVKSVRDSDVKGGR